MAVLKLITSIIVIIIFAAIIVVQERTPWGGVRKAAKWKASALAEMAALKLITFHLPTSNPPSHTLGKGFIINLLLNIIRPRQDIQEPVAITELLTSTIIRLL
eukprot:9031108-Karenia_brevis.AAC.1